MPIYYSLKPNNRADRLNQIHKDSASKITRFQETYTSLVLEFAA
jgi:hypothetical protein